MGARILVVDDDPVNADLIAYMLRAFGHEPVLALGGALALTKAAEQVPDLVLCDIQMPQMDGFELRRRLRLDKRFAKTPIVGVTAIAMAGDRERILAAGFDGLLTKPISPETFIPEIERYLAPELVVQRPPSPIPAERAVSAAGDISPMVRILILDDRAINRQFLAALLRYKGFETREAGDGAEGLDIARGWKADLAIVDVHMPGMDGVEFVRQLQADPNLASIPIILYTATYEAEEAARVARDCDVRFVLMKPSEPEVILAMIDKALGRSETRSDSVIAESAALEFLRLHGAALRAVALVDFQLEIATLRQPKEILKLLARVARNIIPSTQAVVTLSDESDGNELSSREPGAKLRPTSRKYKNEGRPIRTGEPEILLAVPIASASKRYGWLSLTRLGAAEYSVEDERIASTIAAQAAVAYENLLLYDKLHRETELLRATIEASGDGIMVLDRESRFVTFNARFAAIWRIPQELLGLDDSHACWQHALTLLKDPEPLRAAAELASAGQEVSVACELSDGRLIECHAGPRMFEGECIGRVWSFRDFTGRKQAEESLRQSEEKHRTIISNIPVGVFTATADGCKTFISPNIEAITGYTAAEFCKPGKAFWVAGIHPEDLDRVRAAHAGLFEGGQPFDIEYRLRRKEGTWIWVREWSVKTYVREGVLYADGVIHDITERKEAEQESRGVARDREVLLESTGEGIYAMDNAGRCTMANRMAGLLFGRTPEEMIGRRMHPLVHHHNADGSVHPRSQCAIQCALDTGTASRVIDEVFWRKDGTSFPVEYVSSPLMDEGVRRGAVVIFSDVTESRKLQRRLEQASRVSSLGRMAATIAHEFNNVLMGIQPFAEVARRRAGDDVKLQQAASHILNSVARGRNITQDILRVTRPPDPVPQSIDVTEWLEDLAAEIRAVIGERFPVHVRSAAPGTLFARFDPSQMQQVITNLALNARDAMAGGGTLRLSASSNDTTVRLAIGDDGCGIPPETLPFIFEPLFTTKRSGTGLGLAVAQQVVIGNGGTITVESSEAGTTFSIDLPAVPPGVRAAPLELRAPPKNVALRRVVIVEDDLAVARGLTVVLEAEGIAVHVVHLGQEAVPAVEAFRPDAVVIDVGLPDVSGATVYKQLVARWPDMGVIFSTGHAEESVMPQASSRRVGFLRKPYSADTLLSKLREVV